MEYKYRVFAEIDNHKETVISLYKEGKTLREIGQQYTCCAETVRRRLTEWGVRLRTRAEWPNAINNLNKYRFKAIEARRRVILKGEKNGRWKGGTSSHYFKQIVLARDGRKCRKCNYDEHPEIIEVDHIDGNRFNNDPANGMALCPNCHRIKEFMKKTFHTKLRPKRYV